MGIHILFDRRQVMWCSMFSNSDVKGAVGTGLCYPTQTKFQINIKWLFR
jgi:hypothetical protein